MSQTFWPKNEEHFWQLSTFLTMKYSIQYSLASSRWYFQFVLESPGVPEMDICVAFGTADSNAGETYKKIQEAVISIIADYKEYDQIRYSILPFGTNPGIVTAFGEEVDNLDKLIENIRSISRPPGQLDVLKALEGAEKLFDAAPPRPRAKKFLVIFVGSKSRNELEMLTKAAKPLEAKNIKVIAVAVGKESDPSELIKVVPNKGNLIEGEKSYEDPKKLGDEVMVIVLKGEDYLTELVTLTSRTNLYDFKSSVVRQNL